MNIAIIMPRASISYTGGVEIQSRMWKAGLEKTGHHVDLINIWNHYDFASYDFVMFISIGELLGNYIKLLAPYKVKFVIAPIIDYHKSLISFFLRTRFLGTKKLIHKPLHDLYLNRNVFEKIYVRSEYEKHYLKTALGLPDSRFEIVPISLRIDVPTDDAEFEKEDFCLHVSRLDAPEKNVGRLIQAAVKYGFKLVLAGKVHGDNIKWLNGLIEGHDNIEYLGVLKDEELLSLYERARVFALPSIIEGVGMVALEAAAYRCGIVLTEIGGPKEYFDGKASLVNPYSADEIGQAVTAMMSSDCNQPSLSNYIRKNFSAEACVGLLSASLETILSGR